MESQPKSKRPTCSNCSKPLALCLCIRLKSPKLDNKVKVTILQHNLETKHPFNSARIAKLGLKNVDFHTVTDVSFEARFDIRPLRSDHGILSSLGGECTSSICENTTETSEVERTRKREFDQASCLNAEVDADKPEVKALLSLTVGKSGEIRHISHQWKLQYEDQKTDKLEHLFATSEVKKSLAGGFVVKKIQMKQKNGSVEVKQFEEFEITVHPASALLFPDQNAMTIEAVFDDFDVKNLIVLDGTWPHAKKMYRQNPWLKILPSVRLDVGKLSLFSEVRRQPNAGCLSTIESIVYAIKGLGARAKENLQGLDDLLDVLKSMVEDQRRCKVEGLKKLSSV